MLCNLRPPDVAPGVLNIDLMNIHVCGSAATEKAHRAVT